MSDKQIKIKLTLNAIREYVGGAEALLNDIKNAGLTLHKAESGFSMTCNVSGKFSAYTYAYENLSQIKTLMVYDLSNNEIAKLKIEFLELDDNIYDMPDDAYIDGNEIFISFVEIITHTITFTNTEHPEFDVELPESITVIDGESIELPATSGSFEDENYIYTPSTWSIGEFGESVTPTEDMTANLIWNYEARYIDVSFMLQNNNTVSSFSSNGKYASHIRSVDLNKIRDFGLPIMTYHPSININKNTGIIKWSDNFTYTLTGFVNERDSSSGNNNWVEYNQSLSQSPYNQFTCGKCESTVNYQNYDYFGLIYNGSYTSLGLYNRVKYWKCRITKKVN